MPPPTDTLPEGMASQYLEVYRNGRWGGRVHVETSHVVTAAGSLYVWSAGGPTVHVWCARGRTLLRSFPEDADEEWNDDIVRAGQTAAAEKVRVTVPVPVPAACGPHAPLYAHPLAPALDRHLSGTGVLR
jgi:hypothetical protein